MVNKVAIITGAASGIGLSLSKNCITRGINVVMVDCDEDLLHAEVERLSAITLLNVVPEVCDVSDLIQVRDLCLRVYEQFGKVNYLINNAGISGSFSPLWEQTTEQIRHVMDVNLYGVLHGVQSFIPHMLKQKEPSHIINMASFYGLCSGSQVGAYSMSKHAIVALSESLYFDLKHIDSKINVSVVCPSFANTKLLVNSEPDNDDTFHSMMSNLIEHSKSADDVADHIMQAVEKRQFYILPDKEVKAYCEQRTQGILDQSAPVAHSMEKMMTALRKRAL